jgi:hypothetical protein
MVNWNVAHHGRGQKTVTYMTLKAKTLKEGNEKVCQSGESDWMENALILDWNIHVEKSNRSSVICSL